MRIRFSNPATSTMSCARKIRSSVTISGFTLGPLCTHSFKNLAFPVCDEASNTTQSFVIVLLSRITFWCSVQYNRFLISASETSSAIRVSELLTIVTAPQMRLSLRINLVVSWVKCFLPILVVCSKQITCLRGRHISFICFRAVTVPWNNFFAPWAICPSGADIPRNSKSRNSLTMSTVLGLPKSYKQTLSAIVFNHCCTPLR